MRKKFFVLPQSEEARDKKTNEDFGARL